MLTDRLTLIQLEQIEEYKQKYPNLGEIITEAITTKEFVMDLTIKEAMEITVAVGMKLGDIYNVFKEL